MLEIKYVFFVVIFFLKGDLHLIKIYIKNLKRMSNREGML